MPLTCSFERAALLAVATVIALHELIAGLASSLKAHSANVPGGIFNAPHAVEALHPVVYGYQYQPSAVQPQWRFSPFPTPTSSAVNCLASPLPFRPLGWTAESHHAYHIAILWLPDAIPFSPGIRDHAAATNKRSSRPSPLPSGPITGPPAAHHREAGRIFPRLRDKWLLSQLAEVKTFVIEMLLSIGSMLRSSDRTTSMFQHPVFSSTRCRQTPCRTETSTFCWC